MSTLNAPHDPGPIDRDEVELLLPWYVNDTLEPHDKARVNAYLAEHSEFETQIATMREDMGESIQANEMIRAPGAGALDRLMTQIEAEAPQPLALKASATGLLASLGEFLQSLTPGRLSMAAIAAALVITVQAGFLGNMLLQGGSGGGVYETVGENTSATGTAFLIQFNPEADLGAVAGFLESNDAVVISGPENGQFFKIRIGSKTLDEAARAALLTKLGANTDLVAMVLPSE